MPTRRIARDTFSFLGIDFVRMDFGGQEQYREDYMKNPSKYLSGTDLVYFVIDAQDYNRYVEAIDYLDKILTFFKEERRYPPIAILFHKFDPALAKDKEINQKILTLKQALIKYADDFDIFFFETSIYDIKSVMDSFSSGLSLLYDKLEMISRLFSEISKNYNAIMITLFDPQGFTIGEYFRPHIHLKEKMKIYDIYLQVQKRIISENKSLFEFSDKMEDDSRFSGVVEVMKFGNLDFYLLFIVEEEKEQLEKTIDLLDKIEAAKPEMENLILQIIQ